MDRTCGARSRNRHSITPAENGNCRVDFNTWSVVAVVAAKDGEMALCVWKLAFLDVFDPGAIHSDRNVVFLLAGDRAGMAADAAVLVNDETVAQMLSLPYTNSASP